MRGEPSMFGRETVSDCYFKLFESAHLAIEPVERVGAEAIGPGQPGTQIGHPKSFHPRNGVLQSFIFEIKPLNKAHIRCVPREFFECQLGRAILSK